MSENEEKHQIGKGLPRCIGSDADGFERLNSKLDLLNRHHRKDLLESDFAKVRTRTVRKALSRKRTRPGERDRTLLFALYGDPSIRRDLWASAYGRTQRAENEGQAKIHPIPSLEHRILAKYIQESDFPGGGASGIDEVFAEWPDLVQHLNEGVPWAGLVVHAWSDIWKDLDTWDVLNDDERRQTTLVAFAVATIVDDERILHTAVQKVPGLEAEFGDVLNDGDDSETAADSDEEEDVLLRWSELSGSLQTLAAKAAGIPPVVDALAEITHVVGELEEIEQSVRERLARSSFEHLMSHLDGFLGELEADQVFSWLDEKVCVQLHARWQEVQQSLSPEQVAKEIDRLDAGVPAAVEDARKHADALSNTTRQLDSLNAEEPSDFASHHSWEEKLDKLKEKSLSLNREQRQARITLLSELSPSGETFEPRQNYSGSPPAQASAQDTDEPLGSAPAVELLPDAYTAEPVDESIVSTAAATDEEQPTEQAAENEISDVSHAATGDADRGDQKSIHEDEDTKREKESESDPVDSLPPPSPSDAERHEPKGDTEADSRSAIALKRVIEALLDSPPRTAYAVQVGRLLDRLDLTSDLPPVALLEAALLSDRLRLPDAAITAALRPILENFPPPGQFASGSNRDIYVMLALAGTLRPALLAPQSGALAFLTALKPSERLGAVYRFTHAVAEESQKLQGVRIDYTVLRGAVSEVVWEDKRKQLNQDVAEWQAQGLHKTIKYAPATNVWQKWLKSDGLINRLMAPIASGGSDDDASIGEIAAKLQDRKSFEDQVNKTDREEIGRRRGQDIHAGALNRLHAYAREAVEFAHRHLSLNGSKPSQSDFLTRALAELRKKVESLAPPALEELRDRTDGERSLFAGAANIATNAIEHFRELLDPAHMDLDQEPNPKELTASGLFGFSSLHIDDDGTPKGDRSAALDTLLSTDQPEALGSAFERRLTAGDLGTAKRVVDWIEEEDIQNVEEFRNRLDEAFRTEIRQLHHQIDDTRTRVEVALVRGYISDEARASYDADLVDLERRLADSQVLRFDVAKAKLQSMDDKLKRGFMAQKEMVEEALVGLSLAPDNMEHEKITQSIDQGDLVTANELIDRIRRKEPLSIESSPSNQRQVFQEFYPFRSGVIDSALEDSRSSMRVVKQIKEDSEFAGMTLGSIPGAQRESAKRMLEAWFVLKRARLLGDQYKENVTTIFLNWASLCGRWMLFDPTGILGRHASRRIRYTHANAVLSRHSDHSSTVDIVSCLSGGAPPKRIFSSMRTSAVESKPRSSSILDVSVKRDVRPFRRWRASVLVPCSFLMSCYSYFFVENAGHACRFFSHVRYRSPTCSHM